MAVTNTKQWASYEGTNAQPYQVGHFTHRHWLHRYEVQSKDNFKCAICELPISNLAYGCKNCSYYLHEPCSGRQQKIQHPCHHHPLTLRSSPAYGPKGFQCNACSNVGNRFNYNCSTCQYDLHFWCAALPGTLGTGFNYKINLYYSFPNKDEAAPLLCSICKEVVDKNCWMYFNRDTDFVYHVGCAFQERCKGEDLEELISQANNRLGQLQLKN